MVYRLASFGALLLGANGVRSRGGANGQRKTTTFMSGVPVHNYHLAHDDSRWEASMLQKMKLAEDMENYILMMKDGVTEDELISACKAHVQCLGHGDAQGVPFIEITATESQLEEILAKYGDKVKLAEPGLPVGLEPVWEASAEDAWGIRRIRARANTAQPNNDVGPADGGAGVHVYVMDTGVRITHSEFGGRAVATTQTGGLLGLFVNECDADDTSCAADSQGHGTHCSGTVAGKTYGVAKGATVHAVKVLGDNGGGNTFGITASMNWVAKNHIKPAVASMSLGGLWSFVLNAAVGSMVDKGVTVVTASGNSDANGCFFSPGGAAKSINVGSTDRDDARSSFSNFGKCVDIWAPGRDILSAIPDSDTSSKAYSGTSMACPHVSGAAAIVLQGKPQLTPAQVKEQLRADATPDVVTDAQEGSPNLFLFSA